MVLFCFSVLVNDTKVDRIKIPNTIKIIKICRIQNPELAEIPADLNKKKAAGLL